MSCIQVTGLLVIFIALSKLVKSIPNHGSKKFLGHLYWANRYPALGYTEWDAFGITKTCIEKNTSVHGQRYRSRFAKVVIVILSQRN